MTWVKAVIIPAHYRPDVYDTYHNSSSDKASTDAITWECGHILVPILSHPFIAQSSRVKNTHFNMLNIVLRESISLHEGSIPFTVSHFFTFYCRRLFNRENKLFIVPQPLYSRAKQRIR